MIAYSTLTRIVYSCVIEHDGPLGETSFPPPELKMCGHRLRFALVPLPHRPEKDTFYSHRLAWYSHDDVFNISEEDDPSKVMDDAIDENDTDRRDKASEWDRLMH